MTGCSCRLSRIPTGLHAWQLPIARTVRCDVLRLCILPFTASHHQYCRDPRFRETDDARGKSLLRPGVADLKGVQAAHDQRLYRPLAASGATRRGSADTGVSERPRSWRRGKLKGASSGASTERPMAHHSFVGHSTLYGHPVATDVAYRHPKVRDGEASQAPGQNLCVPSASATLSNGGLENILTGSPCAYALLRRGSRPAATRCCKTTPSL